MARSTRRTTRIERRTAASRVAAPLQSRDPVQKRDTFKVAQAHQVLRESVGGLVYQPRPRQNRTEARPISDATKAKPYKVAQTQKKEVTPQKTEVSTLDLAQPRNCKARPTSNKGNGGSRRFIPYCKG